MTPARAERVAGANRVARLWRLFAAVALLVLVAAPAVAGAAMRSWSSPIAVDTTGDQVQVAGVACSSVSQCTAIDGLGREATFDPGSPGAAVPVQIDSGQYLQAISCPSDRQCTAVDANGAELTFDPTAPGKPTPMPIDGGAVSIACPSASQCTAVEPDGREVTFDPTAPGTPTASPTGLGLAVGVACPSANQCTAVDLAGSEVTFNPNSPESQTPTPIDSSGRLVSGVACPSISQCTAVDESGHEVTFDPADPGAPSPVTIDSGSTFRGVACPSSVQCTAFDDGRAVSFDPTAPGAPITTTFGGANAAVGLDCPSVSQCSVVDYGGREATFDPAGSAPTFASIDQGSRLYAVSCPSAGQCTAVGGHGQQATFDPATSSSAAPTTIDDGPGYVADVACPSLAQCTATDDLKQEVTFDPNAPGDPTPLTIYQGNANSSGIACPSVGQCTTTYGNTEATFDPRAPGTVVPVQVGSDGGPIDCPSVHQCTSMGSGFGVEVTFDPQSPDASTSAAVDTGSVLPFWGVSCPTTSQCTAVDSAGLEVTFDPTDPANATTTTIDQGHRLLSIACPSVSACIAVDDAGRAVEGDPSDASSWVVEPVAGAAALLGVSCSSVAQCVAVDAGGNAFVGTPAGAASPDAPTVVTGAPAAVSDTTASLAGTVDPNGASVSDCELQWGTDTRYAQGLPVPCDQEPGSGTDPVAVTAALTGLTPGTIYDYRLVAENAGGRSYGTDGTFTTLAGPRAPVVLTGRPASVGARRATLTGSVNPEGSRVTDCELQWGSDATYEGVPIPCHGVHGAGARPLAVTGEVGGLAPDTVYHYRFVAENAIGRTYGPDRTFTTSRARGRRLFRIATLLSTARPALYARTRDVLRPASGKPARVRVHLFTLTRTALAGQPITIVDGSRTSVARTNRSGIASYRMRPGPDRVVTFRFAGARRYAPAKMELRVRYAPARSR